MGNTPTTSPDAASPKKKLRTFAEFLESSPPDVAEEVDGRSKKNQYGSDTLAVPELNLRCMSETCGGVRVFYCLDPAQHLSPNEINYKFLSYACRNCRSSATVKTFALAVVGSSSTGEVQKLGELPPYGPHTPTRVFRLIGEEYRELFLQGRRAESKGLGIGAYAYYRRIIEHQKGRIIGEILKVAEKLGEPGEKLKALKDARDEKQFSKAIEMVKTAIPQSLLIEGGHNPLTLLHDALSEGIHERSDEECLRDAMNIRIVLVDLAERISTALKEEAELKEAVKQLLNRNPR